MRHRALLLFACALVFGLAAAVLTYQSLSRQQVPVVAEASPPSPPSPAPAPAPPRATLSSMIGDDHRAITIRVNDVLGVGGFVLPGDRVDVLLTRASGNEVPATDVLLQNVRVLGVDQEASDKKEAPIVARAVTLEVTPDEAQRVTLGTQVGTLSLALRNGADSEPAKVRTIGLGDLRSAGTPPVRTVGDGSTAVRVLRGITATETRVAPER